MCIRDRCELFALKMAATLILNGSHGPNRWVSPFTEITIHSDSQASILALNSVWIKTKLVQETLDLLDRASDCCKSLTIRWVKSHAGHSGNEIADQAARDGRDDDVAPDWETPLRSKAVMHSEIDKMSITLWERIWYEGITCRQTRHFYPKGPRPLFYKSLINLEKPIVGQLVQILTGHTHLKRHQAVIDESQRQGYLEALNWDNADDDGNAIIDAADPICSRCQDGDETPLHLLSECESLGTLRLQIFGREDLVGPREIPDFSDIPVHKLIDFFREAKFDSLMMLPFRAQYLPTNTSNEDSNAELRDEKEKGNVEGRKWTSKYLFHIQSYKGKRKNLFKGKRNDDTMTNDGSNSNNNDE